MELDVKSKLSAGARLTTKAVRALLSRSLAERRRLDPVVIPAQLAGQAINSLLDTPFAEGRNPERKNQAKLGQYIGRLFVIGANPSGNPEANRELADRTVYVLHSAGLVGEGHAIGIRSMLPHGSDENSGINETIYPLTQALSKKYRTGSLLADSKEPSRVAVADEGLQLACPAIAQGITDFERQIKTEYPDSRPQTGFVVVTDAQYLTTAYSQSRHIGDELSTDMIVELLCVGQNARNNVWAAF